jgi:hypothetical protein
MAARTRRIELSDKWKDGIRVSAVMKRLYDHCNGDVEMTMSQINAAKIILGKLIPDLARTELSGDQDNPVKIEQEVSLFGEILKNLRHTRQSE